MTEKQRLAEGNGDNQKTASGESMSLSRARALLLDRHNMVVDDNDPIMLLVTLHQGFIADYENMLDRHHRALTRMIGDAVKGLTEEALTESLLHHTLLADRTGRIFKAQYRRAKFLSLANAIAAFICIPVLVYLLIK